MSSTNWAITAQKLLYTKYWGLSTYKDKKKIILRACISLVNILTYPYKTDKINLQAPLYELESKCVNKKLNKFHIKG